MTDDEKIGARLKQARMRAGYMSAKDAALALGVAYPTYAAHENGSRGVVRAVTKYAKRFKVSLDWLLTGKGPQEDIEPDDMDQLRAEISTAARKAATLGASASEIAGWIVDAIGAAFSDIARQQAIEEMRQIEKTSFAERKSVSKEGSLHDMGNARSRKAEVLPIFGDTKGSEN